MTQIYTHIHVTKIIVITFFLNCCFVQLFISFLLSSNFTTFTISIFQSSLDLLIVLIYSGLCDLYSCPLVKSLTELFTCICVFPFLGALQSHLLLIRFLN